MSNYYFKKTLKETVVTSITVCAFSLLLVGGVSADTNLTNSTTNNDAVVTTQPLKANYDAYTNTSTFSQNVSSNQGWYDSIKYSNGQVNVSGWNDVEYKNQNQSMANTAHHYLLLVNARTGQTVSSKSIDNDVVARPDVARVYPHNVNASGSGYSSSISVNWNKTGWNDPLYIVSRYSSVAPYSSTDGNGGTGTYVDYLSSRFTLSQLTNVTATENHAWLDSSNYSDGKLTVSGWNAVKWSNNTNTAGLHHYLIIYDQTRHQQLASVDVTGQEHFRLDVQKAYPSIPNAFKSGFTTSFQINSSAWLTDQLSVVSRYSSVATGNGDDGNSNHHLDYWLNINRPNWNNLGWLDTAYISGNQVHVSGWHATTYSYYEPYHFFILWDKTRGRQVAVVEDNTKYSRADVGRAYPTVYNSSKSGFNLSFNIGSDRSWLTDELQLVSRYSSHNVGNGDIGRGGYTDYWSRPFWLK